MQDFGQQVYHYNVFMDDNFVGANKFLGDNDLRKTSLISTKGAGIEVADIESTSIRGVYTKDTCSNGTCTWAGTSSNVTSIRIASIESATGASIRDVDVGGTYIEST